MIFKEGIYFMIMNLSILFIIEINVDEILFLNEFI
jgi:hypothetical protein